MGEIELARFLRAAVEECENEDGAGYVDDDDVNLTFCCIDGHFDMVKMARIVLFTLNQPST